MKAWLVNGKGEPLQVMRAAPRDLPALGPGEMRVKVAAASLGLPDYMMCTGAYPATPQDGPFTPGGEVVGTVVAVGPGVKTSIGTRVMGMTDFWRGYGSFAEECLVREDEVNPAPDFLSDAAAAPFRIAYHTAWCGIVRNAKAKPGETMLVLGAAGGTGASAVDLGVAVGCRVIAVVAGAEKAAYVRTLGAEVVIDRERENVAAAVMDATGGKGADLIYDPVGGTAGEEAFGLIALEGRFMLVGFASGRWPNIEAWHTLGKNCSLVGVYAGRSFGGDIHALAHREMMELFRQGKLHDLHTAQVDFDSLPHALAHVGTGRQIGRTVMLMDYPHTPAVLRAKARWQELN